jgi:hypothetical protein
MLLLLRRAASAATFPPAVAVTVVSSGRCGWGRPIPTTTTSALRSFSSVQQPMPLLPPSSNHRHVPMPHAQGTVIYTETDEAPALATYSLYPVVSKVQSLVVCVFAHTLERERLFSRYNGVLSTHISLFFCTKCIL